MEDWRFDAKSVSKYDPVLLSDKNTLEKEWTSFSDIGGFYNGVKLEYAKYEEVENKYLSAITLFLKYHNCNQLTLFNHEKYYEEDSLLIKEMQLENFQTGQVLEQNEILLYAKSVFRELIWGELISEIHGIAIRFGYDFYLYFNSKKDFEDVVKEIENIGLFVS